MAIKKASDTREIPARLIPVPDTVSPQMQAIIGQSLDPSFNMAPATTAQWKAKGLKRRHNAR
jgi:hypothetical protein